MCKVKRCFGEGGGRLGWCGEVQRSKCWMGSDGRFQGLFIKCRVKILGLMYMVHGEIPEPNCMGVDRYMVPCLVWVGDVPGPK